MRIEVAAHPDEPPKTKGDLLECLGRDFAHTQGYEVDEQVRLTAMEVDLLCKNRITGERCFAECKALRSTLSAVPLETLLGKIVFKKVECGWLISAGPLGKDAKGFKEEWEQRPAKERRTLSIFTPERLVEEMVASGILKGCPIDQAGLEHSEDTLGEWLLLITPFGRHWVAAVLKAGVATAVLIYDAKSLQKVTDSELLRRLGSTDTTLNQLDFTYGARTAGVAPRSTPPSSDKVVQVEHGDSWADYRPARPSDFVGRASSLTNLLELLEVVRTDSTKTRVFAVTGDSGMGKSSLIAKLRDRCSGKKYRRRFYTYAVDCRAATNATYVTAALVKGLKAAATCGFGTGSAEGLSASDHSDPLSSESIRAFTEALAERQQVVCIVYDQFEELLTKPDLFPVFDEAQRLFLSAVASQSPVALGFAWRTDTTVQQNHPAYYMWHSQTDHRREIALAPFSDTDSVRAVRLFEKELQQSIRPELLRQIVENSRGYPWLLKKLCIHLYGSLGSGSLQSDVAETLDIASLFEDDLKNLSHQETTALRIIAESAPADWVECVENVGADVLRSLQEKRLVIRSGDRANVYWDIFREYLLNGTVPSIPFTYLPSSPSLHSLLSVASQLSPSRGRTPSELSTATELAEKTVGNVIRDLRMFGVATGSHSLCLLESEVGVPTAEAVLLRIRKVLERHALTLRLAKFETGTPLDTATVARTLKNTNPAAGHRPETWRGYAERMVRWLTAAGLLVRNESEGIWIRKDAGSVVVPDRHRRPSGPFQGDAPPHKVVEALKKLNASALDDEAIKTLGFRNAFAVLRRWRIVERNSDSTFSRAFPERDAVDDVGESAADDPTIQACVHILKEKPAATGVELARRLGLSEGLSKASQLRIGNALSRWAEWTMECERREEYVSPTVGQRGKKRRRRKEGSSLFED